MWPVSKFVKEMNATPAQLSMPVETVCDETGKEVTGVLIRKDDEDSELKVRVFRREVGDLESHLSMSSQQLRERQATELARTYEDDLRKVWPAGMSKPGSVLTIKELKARRDAWQEEKDRKEAEEVALRTAMPQAEPTPVVKQEQEAAGEDEQEDENEEPEEEGPGIQLPSAEAEQSKRRKKGVKGKARGKGKPPKGSGKGKSASGRSAAQLPLRPQQPTASAPQVASLAFLQGGTEASSAPSQREHGQESAAGSDGRLGSSKSSRIRRLTPRSKLFEKARYWRETIKVSEILEEGLWGREVWQAGQTLSALQRTHSGEVDVVLLQQHLSVCQAAQEPRAGVGECRSLLDFQFSPVFLAQPDMITR